MARIRKKNSISSSIEDVTIGISMPFLPQSGDITDYFDVSTGLGYGDMIGWALCDGQNGTVDRAGRYERCWGDGEIMQNQLSYMTAAPATSSFQSDRHSHTHTINDRYMYQVVRSSSNTNADGGTYDGDGYDAIQVENGYDDSYTFDWDTKTTNTTATYHNHELSGGDEETKPYSLAVYFIKKIS